MDRCVGVSSIGRIDASQRHMTAFEFHVARAARERYSFDDALFGLSGNVVFADFAAAFRTRATMRTSSKTLK